jgi:sugar/nucleoside kinase (ribokinase family)
VIVAGDDVHIVDAEKVQHVVDSTGAGDAYAAGFLWALARGMRLETCGRIAAVCAAEVISHVGARPETSLAELVRQKLG